MKDCSYRSAAKLSRETALRCGSAALKGVMTQKYLLPLAMTAALLLSACGIKGDLETPPPIWGDKSSTDQPVSPDNGE